MNVVISQILNLPFGHGIYHAFIAIWGMVISLGFLDSYPAENVSWVAKEVDPQMDGKQQETGQAPPKHSGLSNKQGGTTCNKDVRDATCKETIGRL